MKKQFFASILALLFATSAILIADYFLVALIGMIASVFNASAFFYEKVYPYVIALIISTSIAYPLTAILMRRKNNVIAKVHSLFSYKHYIHKEMKSA